MTTIAIDVHDRICQDLHQQIRKLIVENEKLRAAAQQALEAWQDQQGMKLLCEAMDALGAALEQPEQCACGDRPKGQCPGEWEPECDLGNNPEYARRVPLEQPEQEQAHLPEEKLQMVDEYVGDKYHVCYGIGARDVEEVLRQSARLGLVTLNFDTGDQPEKESVAAEREACAKVAEWEPCMSDTPQRIAAAIRARGQA